MPGRSKKPEGNNNVGAGSKPRTEQIRRRVHDARRTVVPRIHAVGSVTAGHLRAGGAALLGGVGGGVAAAMTIAQRMFNGLAVVTAIFRAKLKAATGWVFEQLDAATRPARERLRAITTPVWQLLRTATEFVLQTLDTATRPVRETLGAATAPVRQRLRTATDWLSGLLARPNAILLPVAAGTMALGIAVGRYRGTGLDGEVIVMTMIGGVLMTALLPMTLRGLTDRFPRLARLPVRVVQAAVVVVLATGAAWFAGLGTGKEVVGPASAAAGDLLKLGGMTVRLAGIDVPEREQRCGKDNNKWRCADAAQSALSRVLGGRSVRCRLSGSDEAGRPLGYCSIDGVDINAQLVRQGYVFAQVGLFARYGAQEREARNAKAGMWIGDAQRPEEFRAKAWEEAKRRAPDGCPIKGQVTSGERVYVLPGTPAYERARVLASRGDRWFCSEREAASAGFRAAQRS